MCHVVINSVASAQLSYRQGISNTLIPNVYDYASPPAPPDDYASDLREHIGLGENDPFVLQPTRVVPRKLIERSIEIVSLMNLENPVLVISHASGDEGDHYHQRILEYAEHWGVQIRAIENMVGLRRGKGPNGEKIYSIRDVYQAADLVTYPSGYEGFGNAFLEAIYYRKPIVVNRYSIYIADIEPKGFQVFTIDGFATRAVVRDIREVLENEKLREQTAQKNYELGLRYYSYEVLERDLLNLLYQLSQRVCT
jgi:glycosyltransferase involved in cell wall biosynthesis